MRPATPSKLASTAGERLIQRNACYEVFFESEAPRLACACLRMAERFLRGGRLIAFGRGPYATDAQHVSVEFLHPVIVGKRALPAIDFSPFFESWVAVGIRPENIVMGFGPPGGDSDVARVLDSAARRGAMTAKYCGALSSICPSSCAATISRAFIAASIVDLAQEEAANRGVRVLALRCPDCGAPTPEILEGRELQVTALEVQ